MGGLTSLKPSRLFSAAHFLSTYYIPAAVLGALHTVSYFSFHTIPHAVATQPSGSDAEVETCPGDLVWWHNTVVTHSLTGVRQTGLGIPALALVVWVFLDRLLTVSRVSASPLIKWEY